LRVVLTGMVNQDDAVPPEAQVKQEVIDDDPSIRIVGIEPENSRQRIEHDDVWLEGLNVLQEHALIGFSRQHRKLSGIPQQFGRDDLQLPLTFASKLAQSLLQLLLRQLRIYQQTLQPAFTLELQ